jgi:hypothetical protein
MGLLFKESKTEQHTYIFNIFASAEEMLRIAVNKNL